MVRILKSTSLFLLVVALTGCAASSSKMLLEASDNMPAAEGNIVAKEGKNGNTELALRVKHLARPEAVAGDARTYVVWAQDPNGGSVHNLGALEVNDNLEGTLNTVTPLKQFDLFVTPEPYAALSEPTGTKALWTRVVQQ